MVQEFAALVGGIDAEEVVNMGSDEQLLLIEVGELYAAGRCGTTPMTARLGIPAGVTASVGEVAADGLESVDRCLGVKQNRGEPL